MLNLCNFEMLMNLEPQVSVYETGKQTKVLSHLLCGPGLHQELPDCYHPNPLWMELYLVRLLLLFFFVAII